MGKFYEFFAGGGMARMGLGTGWTCLFANDFDHKKGQTYRNYWQDAVLKVRDVRDITTFDLPGQADLVWASFPCQDLSLAGGGAGLNGERSGTFWPFWKLMKALIDEGRPPRVIVLENVCGTLTSHGGKDFAAICAALKKASYTYGAVVIDAALFVPQSRPRLFIIALRDEEDILPKIADDRPSRLWHGRNLDRAYEMLPTSSKENWIWWALPQPPLHNMRFADLIEDEPESVEWHTPGQTQHLLSMMSDVNLEKVKQATLAGRQMVGTVYKRTRPNENGTKVQRAEVRFDDVAGCLRTPAGGSSRQTIMIVDGLNVRSRLLSPREAARLMGLPDEYKLPTNYNEAYHLAGDGVVVPVVRFLAANLLEPLLTADVPNSQKAA